MAPLNFTLSIAAPLERVFDAFVDIEHWSNRISGITRVEMLTQGAVGVGTRFRETRIMFKKEATEEMEITALDPSHSYTLGCESNGCRYKSDFIFTEEGNGTALEMTFEATPLTFTAKVMSILMKPMMKKMVEMCSKDLDDLKASVEAKRQTAQSI